MDADVLDWLMYRQEDQAHNGPRTVVSFSYVLLCRPVETGGRRRRDSLLANDIE